MKEKCGDLGASEVRHLRQLEDEKTRLKWLETDLTLDKNILQEVIKKRSKVSQATRTRGVD